jgi:hypothetical protein
LYPDLLGDWWHKRGVAWVQTAHVRTGICGECLSYFVLF